MEAVSAWWFSVAFRTMWFVKGIEPMYRTDADFSDVLTGMRLDQKIKDPSARGLMR